MSDTHKHNTIVCEEVFDEFSLPSEEEVIDYAKKIGIDPKCEVHLLPIARNGLMQPLPAEWKPCYDSTVHRWYYYNTETKKSQWEHPLDSVYRQIVKRGRSEGYSSAADDDSKTTAKEDLKSFEEVSDILSSRSNDLKLDENNIDMAENDKGRRTHQPLLLRRKQLQSGGDPFALQVAKVMNNTMKESSLVDFDKLNHTKITTTVTGPLKASPDVLSQPLNTITPPVAPKQLQPLRRAQTLDPISLTSRTRNTDTPIKGILRESSFSGVQSRNLARVNTIEGDVHSGTGEVEDEKKRSVRFADFERKALDIRFQFSDSEESISDEEDDVETGSSSPEIVHSDGQSIGIDNDNKSVDTRKSTSQRLNIAEPIDPNKIKDKLLSRQAIVAPLKIDSIGNGSDYDESQSSVGDKVSLSINSEKLNTKSGSFVSHSQQIPIKDAIATSRFTVHTVIEDNYKPTGGGEGITVKKLVENSDNVVKENLDDRVNIEETQNYDDEIPKEMENMARKKAAEKLAIFEEKLTKEVQEKIAVLKKQQNDTLSEIKENLSKFEEDERKRLKVESETKLAELKTSIEEEFMLKEQEIRSLNEKAVEELTSNLEEDRKKLMDEARKNHELVLNNCKKDEELKLNEEKKKLDDEFDEEVKKQKEIFQSKLDSMKEEEEFQIENLKKESENKLQELEEKYKAISKEEEQKFQNGIRKLEDEFIIKLNHLKVEKESALKRVETEWEDKITATTLQHKNTLESAMIDHENSMVALRSQFQHEEDDLKKYHAEQIEAWNARLKKLMDKEPNSLGQISRDFEKMRCEKRLIEDKYRSLKDKYLQLKTDMKVAVERKLQSRARRKRENQVIDKEMQEDKETIKNDKTKNNNSEETHYTDKNTTIKSPPRIIEPPHSLIRDLADNDPSSDDQYVSTSLSSTLPTDADQKSGVMNRAEVDRRRKQARVKGKLEKFKDRQGNVLDDVRIQLQELEQIEEQIPANSQGETYLRYPFHGPGLSTSAEVDFYRHRVIVEQEAVRAARECLLQQKRELEARQNILRTNNNTSTMQQLQQQERDLTEMEVSLHRTRALLGEKMIRLRLLGQTLNRLVDETPLNVNGGSGDAQVKQGNITNFPNETVPFNVLQNLENINSEIREIWSQLSKHQHEGTSGTVEETTDISYKQLVDTGRLAAATVTATGRASAVTTASTLPSSMKPHRRTPSSRAEIEARIQGLREWLQKPQQSNTDWNQLTL